MRHYHVSPSLNDEAINRQGVDPKQTKGRLVASWWVTRERLLWAIAHVSARHHVAVDEISVWYFDAADSDDCLRKTRLQGVLTCSIMLGVEYRAPATAYVASETVNFARPMEHDKEDFAPPPEDVDDIPF